MEIEYTDDYVKYVNFTPQEEIRVGFQRMKEGIDIPKYEHEGDACMDLKVYPDTSVTLEPGQHYMFDSYIKFNIPKGHAMMVYPRSGLGIKSGIVLRNGTGIIDSNFSDTVKVGLVNTSDKAFTVESGARVAQFKVVPYPKMVLVEEEVKDSGRGEGLGSSGV